MKRPVAGDRREFLKASFIARSVGVVAPGFASPDSEAAKRTAAGVPRPSRNCKAKSALSMSRN
jgi:hypothetical protein